MFSVVGVGLQQESRSWPETVRVDEGGERDGLSEDTRMSPERGGWRRGQRKRGSTRGSSPSVAPFPAKVEESEDPQAPQLYKQPKKEAMNIPTEQKITAEPSKNELIEQK